MKYNFLVLCLGALDAHFYFEWFREFLCIDFLRAFDLKFSNGFHLLLFVWF